MAIARMFALVGFTNWLGLANPTPSVRGLGQTQQSARGQFLRADRAKAIWDRIGAGAVARSCGSSAHVKSQSVPKSYKRCLWGYGKARIVHTIMRKSLIINTRRLYFQRLSDVIGSRAPRERT